MEEKGVIRQVLGDRLYYVTLYINPENCRHCSAHSSCMISKTQDLKLPGPPGLKEGQQVTVYFPSLSKALKYFILFGSPLTIFFIAFFFLSNFHFTELTALAFSSSFAAVDFISMLFLLKKIEKNYTDRIEIKPEK
ncbi:SoxR reducing system RseC family protein [candidate division WOR-3 bacterium]|nr:SoxR reducing system RseC family protein [candidate division WOR-3 bacterium]